MSSLHLCAMQMNIYCFHMVKYNVPASINKPCKDAIRQIFSTDAPESPVDTFP